MKNIQKTIGYILLFPPLLSVLLFTINLLVEESGPIIGMDNLSTYWTGGAFQTGDSGAGFTSSIPLYFGLMAIAGAYLIKNSNED